MKPEWLVAFLLFVSCNPEKPSDQSVLSTDLGKSSGASFNMPDSVIRYITAALNTMQKASIHKSTVDWPQVKKSTFKKAEGATTYDQTYPAIQEALTALGDNHSFLITPAQHKQWLGEDKQHPPKVVFPEGMMLDKKFAFLEIPAFSSGDEKLMQQYASILQAKIKELESENPMGWIIDLSYNSGGNMWPMLAGIGPLTGEGILGSFIASDGTRNIWTYENGKVLADTAVVMQLVIPYKLKNQQAPVALLVSERTASSGEAIVISFIGRPHTKIIGSPTAGLSTANQGYTLADGAQLLLTVAIFADRTGKAYGKQIVPDVDLSDKAYFITGFRQHIMREEAKEWIRSIHKKQ